MKDVSIIIPVYNVQQYLSMCLDSVIAQTYKNIEIIIINDGSTDNSLDIIDQYKAIYPELIVINQENQGLSSARNAGLDIATGEYVAFVDSDDFLEVDYIEKMYKLCMEENSDLCICSYKNYYDINHTFRNNIININQDFSKENILRKVATEEIKLFACNKLFKRDLLIKNNIRFEIGKYYEDMYPIFKSIINASSISIIPTPLYNYRIRENSITTSISNKHINDFLEAMQMIENDWLIDRPSSSDIDLFMFNYRISLFRLNVRFEKYSIKKSYSQNYSKYINLFKGVNYLIKELIEFKQFIILLLIKLRLYPIILKFKEVR